MGVDTKEAVETIKKWGVDCDNFVVHKYHNYMYGGDVMDNSQECADYFNECLKIVTGLGIKAHHEASAPAPVAQSTDEG